MEAQNQPGTRQFRASEEARYHPRFPLQTNIRVYSHSAGLLHGCTVDISESGISAMLKLDLSVGEVVQLEFELPFGSVAIRALVRHQTAFRYGFQFVEPDTEGAIKATCLRLAALQGYVQGSSPQW